MPVFYLCSRLPDYLCLPRVNWLSRESPMYNTPESHMRSRKLRQMHEPDQRTHAVAAGARLRFPSPSSCRGHSQLCHDACEQANHADGRDKTAPTTVTSSP